MSRYDINNLKSHYNERYASEKFSRAEYRLYTRYFHLLKKRFGEMLSNCERLIDLGCGSGIKTLAFANFFHSTVGVDLSQSAIKKAKELVHDSRIEFQCADIFEMQGGRFDVISALGFSYLNEENVPLLAGRISELIGLFGKEKSTMIMTSFTDFSGTAPSGWVMHSKQQLSELQKLLEQKDLRASIYFPHRDPANYINFNPLVPAKEVGKLFRRKRRIFFILIENNRNDELGKKHSESENGL